MGCLMLNQDTAKAWIRRAAEIITENAGVLTELDSAVGDADHGSNLKRGMTAAVEQLDQDFASLEALLKKLGMTLVSTVGGASGPLYGTLFIRMASAVVGHDEVGGEQLADSFEAGVGGLRQRGHAEPGEKTMIDVWVPALAAYRASWQADGDQAAALKAMAEAADAGRDSTKDLVATKGRASYLGERSRGHVDPGAASSAMLIRAAAEMLG
ncbi:dihydroxyacetone kinase subunit DhaL [Parenemella sanctibonifatiensis]